MILRRCLNSCFKNINLISTIERSYSYYRCRLFWNKRSSLFGKRGHSVHVFEKNATAGGRARQLITANGFVFDMGPSWYWMPDIFERFFADFDSKASDFYELQLLDPAFEIVFKDSSLQVPSDFNALLETFETD